MYQNRHIQAQNGTIRSTNNSAVAMLSTPDRVTWKGLVPMCAKSSIPLCSIDGCARPTKSRGMCDVHYKRWWRRSKGRGSTVTDPRLCDIEGCNNPHFGHGWCRMHHQRWYTHGDPHVVNKPSVDQRIWPRVQVDHDTGCWNWSAPLTRLGYGMVSDNGKNRPVHRVVYELLIGPIPDGLEIDHLCRNRACVNPLHLEPVTHAENMRRGIAGKLNAAKTHCPNGHPYSGKNLYVSPNGKRNCRACMKASQDRSLQRKRAEKKRGASSQRTK